MNWGDWPIKVQFLEIYSYLPFLFGLYRPHSDVPYFDLIQYVEIWKLAMCDLKMEVEVVLILCDGFRYCKSLQS